MGLATEKAIYCLKKLIILYGLGTKKPLKGACDERRQTQLEPASWGRVKVSPGKDG